MTKRVDQEKRFAPDKDDKEGDDGGGVDDERLPFKMILGDSAVWTPGEYREVSRRPHRNPIFYSLATLMMVDGADSDGIC